MRVDPEVCATKYDEQVALLRSRAELLRGLGAYVVRAAFPHIDAIVVPSQVAGFGVQEEARSRGGIILPGAAKAVPGRYSIEAHCQVIRPNAFGVRFTLDDFDLRAPSVTFHHPASWALLSHAQIPQAIHVVNGAGFNLIHDRHPTTKVPFFCLQGVREYHEHPQHTGDDWMLYRGSSIFTLLTTLIRNINNCMLLFVMRDRGNLPARVDWVMLDK